MLSACVSHFGSSVKGISDVASEAYDNAVGLATSELVTADPDSVLAALLSENMATLDWKTKAKYPGLRYSTGVVTVVAQPPICFSIYI